METDDYYSGITKKNPNSKNNKNNYNYDSLEIRESNNCTQDTIEQQRHSINTNQSFNKKIKNITQDNEHIKNDVEKSKDQLIDSYLHHPHYNNSLYIEIAQDHNRYNNKENYNNKQSNFTIKENKEALDDTDPYLNEYFNRNNNQKNDIYKSKYFNKIRKSMINVEEDFLQQPSEYFLDKNPFVYSNIMDFISNSRTETIIEKSTNKTSSLNTIFTVWTCMIGSGVLSLPWAIMEAGLIPTIFIIIIFGFIGFYTCNIYLKIGLHQNDFSDAVAQYFGRKYGFLGRSIQIIASILLMTGCLFIFFLIISQNLFPLLAYIINIFGDYVDYDKGATPNLSSFSMFYSSLILSIVLFPLFVKRELDFLIKLNSYGIYFVIILILYVVGVFISSIIKTDYDFEYKSNNANNEARHLLLFGKSPFKLCGSLTLGYFSHTFCLPIMKNNKNQKNNTRDLLFGYLLVALTFFVVGVCGYIGFSGKEYSPIFKDNWLLFYEPNVIHIVILRFFSILYLCTIIPIIAYVIRIQFFGTFFCNPYPSNIHVFIYAFIMLSSSLVISALAYNSLGKLMSVIGALFGFILVYFIPIIMNMIYYRRKHPPMELVKEYNQRLIIKQSFNERKNNNFNDGILISSNNKDNSKKFNIENKEVKSICNNKCFQNERNTKYNEEHKNSLFPDLYEKQSNSPENNFCDKLESISEETISQNNQYIIDFEKQYTKNEDLDLKDQFILTGKVRNPYKDFCFYFLQFSMLLIGLGILILQFITVNLFNVHIN